MTPDQLAKQFGQTVKHRRKRMQMTQQQLAERAELSRSEISRIENANRHSMAFAFGLAEALGCNLSTLVKEAEGNASCG